MMAAAIRVLYVDDEKNLLELCKTFLERTGDFIVTIVPSAPEALRILELARFDAIISDYQMPEMDGIEFLKVVRGRGDKTPFIIFTGKGREEVVIEALNSGADFYLQKGGEPKAQFAELAHKIRHAVSLRQTGDDLKESEKKYRRFIEIANEGIWQMDGQFATTFVNQKMAEMLGYTSDEMKGRNVSSFMHPDDLADHTSRMEERREGRADQYERRFVKKDGTVIWTIVSATALEDPDGTFKGSFAMFTDITERKKAELALRKERDFANSIVGTAQAIILILDTEGHIVYMNPFMEVISGYILEEVKGNDWFETFLPSHTQENTRLLFRKAIGNTQTRGNVDVIITKDGRERLIEWYDKTLKSAEGSIEGLLAIGQDITERKHAEEALKRNEERYRAIVEDQTEFICRFTPDGKLTFVNDAYCRYFSLNKDQCLTHPHTVVLPPEDVRQMKQHLALLTPQNPVATIEHRIIMPSGEVRWQRWNDRAIFDQNGNVVEYQSVGRDITEIKNAEKTLREREAYYRAVFENTGTASVIVEEDTTISLANEEFAVLSGYPREDLEGKKRWTEFVVEEDLERMLAQHHSRRKDRKKAERHYEFRFVRKSGEIRNIFLSIDVIPGTKKSIASLADITEYKKAEQALRETDETHRLVLEFAGISSTLWTTDGQLLMINRYGAANLGGVSEDFLGKTMAELFGPEAGAVYLERIRQVAATGTRMEFEDRVPLPEGDRWFLSAHTGIKGAAGQAKRVMIFSHDITQRKIAEQAHRDSTDQLSFAIEGAHLGLWDVNYTNLTISHNRYWNEMLGYGPEDSARSIDWWRQSIHPDDLPVIDAASSDHQNGKTPVLDIVYRIRHRDGRWLWIHTIGRVISRSAEGKPLRMSGINQDITELKQAEIAIREREEKFREIFNNINDAIHLHEVGEDGSPGKFIDVNDVACQMVQYSRDEMLKHSPLDFATPYHSRPLDTIMKELRTVGHATFETGHKRKDGTIVPVEINAHKITLMGRTVVLSVVRDITERKQWEATLRTNEERLDLAIESAHFGVWDLNIVTNDVVHNRRWTEMLGFSTNEMEKPSDWWGDRVHPDDYPLVEKSSRDHFSGKVPFFDVVYRMKHKDGSWRWVHSQGKVVSRDSDGRPLRMIGINQDVTDRKQIEEALRESEASYRQFFATSRDSVFITTPAGKFVDFNDVILDLLGYRTREELADISIPDLYEDADVRNKFNAIIIQNGYVEDYPVRLRKKDGTIIDTLITTVSLKAEDGSVKAFFGTIRDVTEKKRADEEIRTLQQFQQSIIDNAKVWISVLDPKGSILVWNTTAEEISGYLAKDVIGKNTVWKQLYPNPVYRKQVAENILNIINKNTYVENFETRIRTKGGDEKIIWWNTQPLRDASGKPVQFIAIGRDNTERRLAEEKIKSLRQFEESVIKNANIWISVLDGKGNVSVWNRAAEEISGYRADEVLGKNTIWSRMYPDKEYRRTVTTKIKEVIGAHKYLENFETRIRTKDGQERIIWWNTRVLQDVPGIDETFIAIGKDVTEQKTLSDAVTLANKKLNLLSSITRHDIKNQLMALLAYLELCGDGSSPPAQQAEYIKKAQQIAGTIGRQINVTKDYQEMGIAAPVWQNANECIRKAIAALPMRSVHVEVDPGKPEVYSDLLFEKVFYNLIDNALRYGGADMKTIRFSSVESATGLLIVCEDDGVGISAEDKKKLFTRGFGKHTGLGLFLSREILAITGITITENGTPGKGARFEITVPKGMYRFTSTGNKK